MSADHPSLIIGTNYGRIFIISMFLESDEKVFPVVVIDSHHQSPITQLFIAYNSSRKAKTSSRASFTQYNSRQSQKISYDTGGHLISVSENGTIAITNLNSGEMHKQLHNFSIKNDDIKKADSFMSQRFLNQKEKRRNSFSSDFSVERYFYLVKAKSQKVYDYATFSEITKIIEVKNLNEIQNKIVDKSQSKKTFSTPDVRHEDSDMKSVKKSGGSSMNGFDTDYLVGKEFNYSLPCYGCISADGTVFILQISNLQVDLQCYTAMDSQVIGVYQDDQQQIMYFLTKNLSFYAFNKKSKTLVRKSDFNFAISVLQIKESVNYFLSKIHSFSQNHANIYDYYSFEKFFQNKNILMGLGSHKILDFLNLSLNLPLNYHPNSLYSNKYTKGIHDLMKFKIQFSEFEKSNDAQKTILRAFNDAFFINNHLYNSDFNQYYFQKQSGVTSIMTKNTVCRSQQQMFIVETKQVTKVLRHKMQKSINQFGNQKRKSKFESNHENHQLLEEEKHTHLSKSPYHQRLSQSYRNSASYRPEVDILSKIQWPTRLLSLIHPFNISEQVDIMLEQFFGLNIPFLDFRIGVQGIDESFSFVITKEDEEYHSDRKNLQKIIRLFRISAEQKDEIQQKSKSQQMQFEQIKVGFDSIREDQYVQVQDNEPLGRFFNSEYWKISSYLSTITPTLLLSILVSIIEFAQNDVKYLLQEWLFILQRINKQRTISNANEIQMAVISKILLMKDHNISSTARDIIMKPNLFYLDMGNLKASMDEWQSLILDTYNKLRIKQNLKISYGGQAQKNDITSTATSLATNLQQRFNGIGGGSSSNLQNQIEIQQINQFFGELEIRSLINISYFTLYFSQEVEKHIQYRVSKLTIILTREIVQKFTHDKKYIHLLTTLLQLLSTWMKTQQLSQKSKVIVDQVIKLLLILYNIYKRSLDKEQFLTRVAAVNYHLIRPNDTELYLKLTAAKALLEIGENFTHDYFQIIQEQATNLNEGTDYQQNVLEILRCFINSYGENLEHHLIQLTQILLKCLDPNDLPLRKNSHQKISLILSTMVKIFPMVAFHHESQRLAVGTHDGPIAIYDVRTSAKWKILEGHQGNVTCLTFDSKGNLLASYSSVDLTVRLWKVGNTGFFSTIMGGTGKCSKEIKLDSLLNVRNPHQLIQQHKQQQLSNQNQINMMGSSLPEQVASKTQGDGKKFNKCQIQFIKPKEKEVELVREDGQTKMIIKLVK